MPPWLWTIAFGSPVVPEEYRTHSGWSKGTGVNSSSVPSPAASSSSQPIASRRPLRSGSGAR